MFGNEFIHAIHTFVNLQIVLILWKTGQMVYNSSHKWLLIYLSTNSNNDAIMLYSNQMNHLFNTSYFLLSVLFNFFFNLQYKNLQLSALQQLSLFTYHLLTCLDIVLWNIVHLIHNAFSHFFFFCSLMEFQSVFLRRLLEDSVPVR